MKQVQLNLTSSAQYVGEVKTKVNINGKIVESTGHNEGEANISKLFAKLFSDNAVRAELPTYIDYGKIVDGVYTSKLKAPVLIQSKEFTIENDVYYAQFTAFITLKVTKDGEATSGNGAFKILDGTSQMAVLATRMNETVSAIDANTSLLVSWRMNLTTGNTTVTTNSIV